MNILATAPSTPYVQVAEGTFTQANSRLSLVDGTAFFDCGADLSAYAGLDTGSHEYLIKVYDNDGNSIQGYVGAVGGGETLSGELVTGWTNQANPFDTLTVNGNGHDIDSLINLSDKTAQCNTNENMTVGELYKIVTDITLNTGTSPRLSTTRAGGANRTVLAAISDTTKYWVAASSPYDDTGLQIYSRGAAQNLSLLISQKQLTDCAATGFHIISAQGGSTQNWQNVGGSFNANDPAGYKWKMWKVR